MIAILGCAARWLLIVPLVFFSLFASGTMIETPAAGGMRIVLCTGDGMVEAIMTADGQILHDDGSHPDDHGERPACDWAVHTQPALAAVATDIGPAPVRELSFTHPHPIPHHARRAEVLTPAARGPPTLV